jgi:hypothetical protein
MTESTKKTLITGTSILLITAGLFFVSRAILRNLKAKKEDELISSGGNEQGSGNTLLTPSEESEAKNYNPSADAKYLNDRLYGWLKPPFVFYDQEINGLLASLTDAKLKKLAPYYKTKYKKSLWLALDEEWDAIGSGNLYIGAMNRLSSLGLK